MMERPKLPLRVQVGYATADIGMNAVEMILRLYVLVYYTEVVGLDAALAGLAAGLAIFWDAVTDPLMGLLSDRTRHRFGGRRGYLPAGGIALAIGVVGVFWPPPLASQAAKFSWLLFSFCFLNTGLTLLSVPFTAMAGEMTEDPHERSVLFGWRFACSNFGALLAAALPTLFLTEGASVAHAMPATGLVLAGLVLATTYASHAATASIHFLTPPLRQDSLLGAFVRPFASRPFRPLLGAYVLANTGIAINAATFHFYYQQVLRLPQDETMQVLTVFMLVFTVSILGWVRLAKQHGKQRPLTVGATVLGIGTATLYLFVPAGGYVYVMVLGAIGLGSFVGCVVLIDTMVTDVLDHDQLRTQQLRSGMFFGVWRFAGKLARALSVVVVGAVLGAVGFAEQGADQPPAVATALTWLFGPGVGSFFLLTAWVLHRYRFDEGKQAQVRRLLLRRTARSERARLTTAAGARGEPPW